MNNPKCALTVRLWIALLATFQVVACVPAPAIQSTVFDMRAALDQYFSNLPNDWSEIAPVALEEQLRSGKPFLVDVGEANQVAESGYIAGAINIPLHMLVKNLNKLPAKGQPIIVTCGSGHRSALGMEALQLLGYTNVKSLGGGLNAWKAAGLPVTTGALPEARVISTPAVDKELLAALDRYFSDAPESWSTIAPATLNQLLKSSKPLQVDLRETNEVTESGSIAGAINIPLRMLIKHLDKLPPDKGAVIVTECSNGHRGAMAMLALNLLGYTNVRSLAGGFTAWTKAGLPVSRR